MNKFPCKTCLVRVNCSEYCNDLIEEPRVIDIYVVSLKQCPDCGGQLNIGSPLNKTNRVCFECSKVFQQETFIKKSQPKPKLSSVFTSNIINRVSIITDITNLDPPKSIAYTMEETHDILYNRLDKSQALYIIQKINLELKNHIMRNPKKRKAMKMPSWEGNYKSITDEISLPEDKKLFL